MDRKIYHGSSHIVRPPKFGTGNQYNDFGLGFYCSEYPQYAAEWAVGRDRNGFVSSYSINCDGLRIINLCGPQYVPLHWISLLMNFREFDMFSATARSAREYINKYFSVDYQGSDCIIGYRADNRCFMFAQDFMDGRLSYGSLKRALSEDSANRQFVLKSNRAFDRIAFTGYETADSSAIFPSVISRELRSIRGAGAAASAGDFFVQDLLRDEVSPYDTRL